MNAGGPESLDLDFVIYTHPTADAGAEREQLRLEGDTGNLGLGTGSPGAKLEVRTGTAGTVGQIIRGTTSQTADLQQWQQSDGSIRSRIFARGGWRIAASTGKHLDIKTPGDTQIMGIDNDGFSYFNMGLSVTGGTYGVALGATSSAPSYLALQVRGSVSQTADL